MRSACTALMTYLVSRFRFHEALRLENAEEDYHQRQQQDELKGQ
jgi:hypothetical protein